MILGHTTIKEEIAKGRIKIEPYEESHVGPNSVDLRLSAELYKLVCEPNEILDITNKLNYEAVMPSEEGTFTLMPNELYLGRTIEKTHTDYYVPCIEGRSSIARAGVEVHISAGFGDIGFNGYWTLEIRTTKPIKIPYHARIAQIYFLTNSDIEFGKKTVKYCGNYQFNFGVDGSKFYLDYKKERESE
jgi:dCTP deaminase